MAIAIASPAATLASPEAPAGNAYRPDIDALRAFAITIVVAFHAGVPGFTGGFIGVDVFFVISGFVIMSALSREFSRTGRVDWPAFFARRVRRLVPAAVAMIVVTIGAAMLLLNSFGEQQSVAKSAIAAATSTSNLYFAFSAPVDYFAESGPEVFLHTWSLSVEEQFYLTIPLILALAAVLVRRTSWGSRRSLVVVLGAVVIVSLIVAVLMAEYAPTSGFFIPIGRGYELGIGALLAIVRLPEASPVIRRTVWAFCAAVLVIATIIGLPAQGFPGALALIPVLATAGLIWAHVKRNRVLLSRPVLGIGKVSYGWYLWHWPLLTLAAAWNLRDVSVAVNVALVLIALGISVVSYRMVETRFRYPANRNDNRRWPVIAAGLTALVATSAIAFAAGELADHNRESNHIATRAGVRDTGLPAQCFGVYNIRRSEGGAPCFVNGFDSTRPTVVVWGDSHGRMLMPAFVEAAGQQVNLVEANLAGCPPYFAAKLAADAAITAASRAGFGLCQAHNFKTYDWIAGQARDGHDVRVVMTARWPLYLGRHELEPHFDAPRFEMQSLHEQQIRVGTKALVDHLVTAGARIDFIVSEPALRRSAPDCLSRTVRYYDCDISRADVDDYRRDSLTWLSELHADAGPNSRWIDLIGTVCDEETCYAERNGVITFRDDNHLSQPLVDSLQGYFAPSVSR